MRFSHVCLILIPFTLASRAQDAFPLRPSEGTPGQSTEAVVPAESEVSGSAETGAQVAKPDALPAVTSTKREADGPVEAEAVAETEETGLEGRVVQHVIASGDSLTQIAAEAYGRAGYWRLLKLYNECDPAKLRVGQVIRVPELEWLLEEEGVLPKFAAGGEALLRARELFMEAEATMALDEREEGETSPGPDADTKAKIVEAQGLLEKARNQFSQRPEGVTGIPNSMLLQLRTAGELMGAVAAGGEVTVLASKVAEVHERFGNALTYGVIWAREGFN